MEDITLFMDRELPRMDEINGVYYLRHEEYATLKYEIKNGKIVAICLSNYLG